MYKLNERKTIINFAIIAAITCLLTPSISLAQDQAAEADSAYGQPELEEITVTARKRVENLQEVALSVSTMGAKEIESAFATDILGN